jgi:hypothetical protein
VDVAAEEPQHEEEEEAAQDGPFDYHAFLHRVSCVGPIVASRKCMDAPQCTRTHFRENTQSSRRHTRRNISLSKPYWCDVMQSFSCRNVKSDQVR